MTRPVTLAVIVIARNEERTIQASLKACLESVRLAQEHHLLNESRVVLVDSASTDRTREIAASLPVEVVVIPAHWPLSAAAGRFVGVRHTHSDVLLFVDGDYVLDPAWLTEGLAVLHRPGIAGVCGADVEALEGHNAITRYVLERTQQSVPTSVVSEAEAIAVGLYWRKWVEEAGGVQPFLRGAEDRDLAIRIKALGGHIVRTRTVMGTHHWAPGEVLTLMAYFQSVAKWSFGEGQAARFASDSPRVRAVYFSRYFHARHLLQLEEGLIFFSWLLGILASVLTGQAAALAILVGTGGASVALSARVHRENIMDALFRLHVVPYSVIRLGTFVLGYLNRPAPSAEYPAEVPPQMA